MRRPAPLSVVARLALWAGALLAPVAAAAQPRRPHRGTPPAATPPPDPAPPSSPPAPTPLQGAPEAPEAPGAAVEAAPSAEVLEVARRLFREGVEAAQAGRWEEARMRFARVLGLRAAPLVRFNLAVASRNVGRFVEAIDQYRQFLRDIPAGSDPVRSRAALEEVTHLEARRAFVRVQVAGDVAAGFVLDGRPLPVSLLGEEIPVDPGPHTVDVEGRAGDRQRREGTLYEAERITVEVALSIPPAGTTGTPGTRAVVQAQPFGHWVARPGRDGRWVDWARRSTREPPSVWAERPLSLGIQLVTVGGGAHLGATARWFPQTWAGLELSVGGGGTVGVAGAATVHLRVPFSRVAVGVYGGPTLGRGQLTLCDGSACAPSNRDPVRSVTTAGATAGASLEWRITRILSARLLIGAWMVGNAGDLGGEHTPATRATCDTDTGASLLCAAYRDGASLYVTPVASLDLSWSF